MPRQNGHRFADNTFKRIFSNENFRISIKISLKFVPKGPMNNNPALVQIMAWCRSGGKPLSEPMMISLLTHICVTRPQWVKQLHQMRTMKCIIIAGKAYLRAFSNIRYDVYTKDLLIFESVRWNHGGICRVSRQQCCRYTYQIVKTGPVWKLQIMNSCLRNLGCHAKIKTGPRADGFWRCLLAVTRTLVFNFDNSHDQTNDIFHNALKVLHPLNQQCWLSYWDYCNKCLKYLISQFLTYRHLLKRLPLYRTI